MTVISSPSDQVAYESRVRMRYAIVAFAAGLFIVLSLLIQEVGYHNSLTEITVQLLTLHRRFPLDLIGAIVDALGLWFTGYLLWWLNSISLARDPRLSPITRWLVLVGAPIMGICEIGQIVLYSVKSASFYNGHNYGYPAAYGLIHPAAVLFGVFQIAEEFGALLLAAGAIWTALNAMKVGLLPRPLGYAGVVSGALIIFAVGVISFIVEGLWLVCMAVIISGRWPTEPPAWAEGIAIPWLPGGKPNYDAAGAGTAGVATVVEDDRSPQQAPDYTPRRKKKKR